MSVSYKKISEVEIWHDYYMTKDSNDNDVLLKNYSILNDLDFVPTQKCAEVLKNKKIIFKKSPKGFQLFARIKSSTANQTFIFIEPTVKLDFFVLVKNSFFSNFTNIRLTDKNKLFYFSNIGKTAVGTNVDLTMSHPAPIAGNLFTIDMQLSDIFEEGGNLLELKKNVSNGDAFNANDAIEIGDNLRKYVSTQDALSWQNTRYEYFDSNNSHPGELVQFTITDALGNIIDLGVNTSTGLSQSKYRAPLDAGKPLQHIIDFSKIPQGKYTLSIDRVSNTIQEIFYLLDNKIEPNAFGKIELVAGDNQSGMVTYQGNESIIANKVYAIRFKNRTTIWKYFNKDGSEKTDPNDEKFNPLTQQPSKFEIAGTVLPDPDISMIYPEKDLAGNIIKIYSETYLNQ